MPGESEIISLITGRLGAPDPDVLVGPGDDAAVVRASGNLVVTTDTVISGVHFDLRLSSPADAGFKAVTSAVSDVAAMGARPRWAVVAVALGPGDAGLAADIATGLGEGAQACGVRLIGGDTCQGGSLTITVTVIGEASGPSVLRSGAVDGDLLCVTGPLGAAASGLRLLRSTDPAAGEMLERFPSLAAAHRRPIPRIAEGAALAAAGVHAMVDLSDGLSTDAAHIARASGLGLMIEAESLPLAPGVKEAAEVLGLDPSALAVAGGEDYELAVAVAPEALTSAGSPLTAVGRFDASGRIGWTGSGPMPAGYDHFS